MIKDQYLEGFWMVFNVSLIINIIYNIQNQKEVFILQMRRYMSNFILQGRNLIMCHRQNERIKQQRLQQREGEGKAPIVKEKFTKYGSIVFKIVTMKHKFLIILMIYMQKMFFKYSQKHFLFTNIFILEFNSTMEQTLQFLIR